MTQHDQNPQDVPFAGFRVGVQSYCYREFSLKAACEQLKGLGLSRFEIFPGHSDDFNENADPENMKAFLKAAGVECPSYGVVGLSADEEKTGRLFQFASAMGIEMLSADPEPDSFPLLDRLVKEHDICVGIHNHGPGSRYDKLEDVATAVEPWDTRIGACVDTGHFLRSGVDPVDAIRRLGNRVHGVHLKDFSEDGVDSVIGTARLNVLAVLKVLKENGFCGHLAFEYEGDADNPSPALAQGVAVLKAMVNSM